MGRVQDRRGLRRQKGRGVHGFVLLARLPGALQAPEDQYGVVAKEDNAEQKQGRLRELEVEGGGLDGAVLTQEAADSSKPRGV